MPSPTKAKRLTASDWLSKLEERYPPVRRPGYWDTIAENASRWAQELVGSPFWSEATARLDQWRHEYRAATGANLLTKPGLPPFQSKPRGSIKSKLCRKCAQETDYLKRAISAEGPPIPRMGDLVRTRVACAYIDGVEFLATKMELLAVEMSLQHKRRREGRVEGYFAQHLMIAQKVEFREAGAGSATTIMSEIQIASELATKMWSESHSLYENSRDDDRSPDNWQWRPQDPRFISHQLGHMIHLADGLLVQLRIAAPKKA